MVRQHMNVEKNEKHFAYLAGFLDGDGCLNEQIIRRPEYRLGFQIRVSTVFFTVQNAIGFYWKFNNFFPGDLYLSEKMESLSQRWPRAGEGDM